jgi:hypothetical protein
VVKKCKIFLKEFCFVEAINIFFEQLFFVARPHFQEPHAYEIEAFKKVVDSDFLRGAHKVPFSAAQSAVKVVFFISLLTPVKQSIIIQIFKQLRMKRVRYLRYCVPIRPS